MSEIRPHDASAGTWIRRDPEAVVIGASLRTPFAFIWALGALAWLLLLAAGVAFGLGLVLQSSAPRWPGILVLVSMIIPMRGLIWAFVGFVLAIAGKVEFRIGAESSEVFVGVGSLGTRRTFRTAMVRSIGCESLYARSWGAICIRAEREIVVGFGLARARRDFVVEVLRKTLPESPAFAN